MEAGGGAGSDADYPARPYAWSVVALLFATAVLSYTDRQVLSLLVDPIRAALGVSDMQVSLLMGTAFAIVYGTAGIALGSLADGTSRRNLIIAGVVVWSLGTIACGLAHSFSGLFTARIVVGLGEAVLSPASISLISDYFPPSRRGMAVGCYLSGIAMGVGVSILIGGGVLHAIELGALAGTPLAALPAWRLVLLVIGAPGLLWSLVILLIREPRRQVAVAAAGQPAWRSVMRVQVIPMYLVVAMASLVDNAVGGWAPSLLIRQFGRDPAGIGVQLGLLLTVGFGGGVLAGGWLADRAGQRGGWSRKLGVCLLSSLVIVPGALLLDAPGFNTVLLAIPLYFAFSGIVTACGFSAILDAVPNRSRGLAMGISFFLNVALGASAGPAAVSFAGSHVFGVGAGLGPAIAATVSAGYAVTIVALILTLLRFRNRQPATE